MPDNSSFLKTPAGKALAGVFVAVGVVLAAWTIWGSTGANMAAVANRRLFIDASNGQSFWVSLDEITEVPTMAPSGQKTGYPAELCYWTADGKPKSEPTGVLLNETVGKPGPTFCPDCKRLVVGRNPSPVGPDFKPPPTEAEYRANPARNRGGGE